MLLNCVLFYSLEKSQCAPLLFFSFLHFLSSSFFFFFFEKKISFTQWGKFAFSYFFWKSHTRKNVFTYRKKQEIFFFFNVLVLRILSSIIEYCKLETPENTDYCICQVTYQYWMKRHSEIAWNSRDSFRETSIITEISDWNRIHCPNIVLDIYPNYT